MNDRDLAWPRRPAHCLQGPGLRRLAALAGLAAVALAFALPPAQAEKLYKWEDEDGIVYYADKVPAEHVKRERKVLNEQGVPVQTLSKELTAEELAAELHRLEREEALAEEARRQHERDRMLLATYLSVEEIEMLRDRRVNTLDAHLKVNEHYTKSLRDRLFKLELEGDQYNYPYSPESDLPPLPDDLAEDILETATALARREAEIDNIRAQQSHIKAKFEAEIERFRMLKGLPPPESLADKSAR